MRPNASAQGDSSLIFKPAVLRMPRRRDLPGAGHEREIPWRHESAHADGVKQGVVQMRRESGRCGRRPGRTSRQSSRNYRQTAHQLLGGFAHGAARIRVSVRAMSGTSWLSVARVLRSSAARSMQACPPARNAALAAATAAFDFLGAARAAPPQGPPELRDDGGK